MLTTKLGKLLLNLMSYFKTCQKYIMKYLSKWCSLGVFQLYSFLLLGEKISGIKSESYPNYIISLNSSEHE